MTVFDMTTMPRTSLRFIHAMASGAAGDEDAAWLTALCAVPQPMFVWLNTNLPVDPRRPLSVEDIAHVSLMPHEFEQIPPDEEGWCPYRRIAFRRAAGIEFWCTPLALPPLTQLAGLRGRIAWKMTGNTAALFRHGGRT